MRWLIAVLVFHFVAALGFAAEEGEALKARLTQQAKEWDRAIVRKDRAGIEGNIGEGFRHIGPNAEVSDQVTFVSDLLSPDLTIDPYTVEDLDIRIHGEIALLSGTTKMTGTYQGKPFKSHYRYVDIYHLENGRWVVINIQVTRVGE